MGEAPATPENPSQGRGDAEPPLDPDCRDGKCSSCTGGPCEHECHHAPGGVLPTGEPLPAGHPAPLLTDEQHRELTDRRPECDESESECRAANAVQPAGEVPTDRPRPPVQLPYETGVPGEVLAPDTDSVIVGPDGRAPYVVVEIGTGKITHVATDGTRSLINRERLNAVRSAWRTLTTVLGPFLRDTRPSGVEVPAADPEPPRRDAPERTALRVLAQAAGRVLEDWAESRPAGADEADGVRAAIEAAIRETKSLSLGLATPRVVELMAAAVMDRVVAPILRERDEVWDQLDRDQHESMEQRDRADEWQERAESLEAQRDRARADARGQRQRAERAWAHARLRGQAAEEHREHREAAEALVTARDATIADARTKLIAALDREDAYAAIAEVLAGIDDTTVPWPGGDATIAELRAQQDDHVWLIDNLRRGRDNQEQTRDELAERLATAEAERDRLRGVDARVRRARESMVRVRDAGGDSAIETGMARGLSYAIKKLDAAIDDTDGGESRG